MRYEIQASTFNSVDGGDWVQITHGKTIEQAIYTFIKIFQIYFVVGKLYD